MGCSVQHGTGFSFHLAYLPMCRVQFPEAHYLHKEKAPAEPEAPKPSLASEEPRTAPKCEKNGQFCLF